MTDIDVIGLGALNTDRIYLTSRTLDDGEAVVTEAGSFPGGSAANTIYGLARLGVTTGFAGATMSFTANCRYFFSSLAFSLVAFFSFLGSSSGALPRISSTMPYSTACTGLR